MTITASIDTPAGRRHPRRPSAPGPNRRATGIGLDDSTLTRHCFELVDRTLAQGRTVAQTRILFEMFMRRSLASGQVSEHAARRVAARFGVPAERFLPPSRHHAADASNEETRFVRDQVSQLRAWMNA